MRLYLSIFVLIFGFSQNLRAQQWVEDGSLDTIRVQLKLRSSGDVQQNEINNSLRSIAYTNQKPVENLQIDWELIASYQVFRQEQGNFKSDILIIPMAPKGDMNLYEFNSSEYILPTLQSFRLRIYKEDGSLVYLKNFNENALSVNSAGQVAHFSIWHQRWGEGYYMKIDQFEFNYKAGDYSFAQWFQFTNDYIAANYLVSDLLKNYRQKQDSPQESLPFLIKSLRQVNYLIKLYQMPFYQATIGARKDPDQLEQKVKMLSILLDLNIEKYVEIFKHSVSSKSNKVEHFISSYLLEEENLLNLQQSYGSMYKELFTELSKTNYPANLTYENINIFDLIEDKMAVDKKQYIVSFEKSLYAKSIINIDTLITQQYFSEALFYIDNLEGFVRQSNSFELSDSFKKTKAVAAYGMYYSYVKVVDKAIQAKNLNLAAQYLRKAGMIQEAYPQEIITNGLAEKKTSQLVDIFYADYNSMINQNMYSNAAVTRDNIRKLIYDFRIKDKDDMLLQLNLLDNLALKKQD